MSEPPSSSATNYTSAFQDFYSPFKVQFRRDAYGEEIGQHSWTSSAEVKALVSLLGLSATARVLDVGCGPGGPLLYAAEISGCSGVGVDINREAVAAAQQRAAATGVSGRVEFFACDCNEPLPHEHGVFQSAISLDVVLHLKERRNLFTSVFRALEKGARFFLTDAAILTGTLSASDLAARSMYGLTQVSPPGFNEELLKASGFSVLETFDSTSAVIANARGRLKARELHRATLLRSEGPEEFSKQTTYLEKVGELAEKRTLSRFSYLAAVPL